MFDLDRFARLAAAHWAEHRRGYAWFLGIGVMLQLVLVMLSFASKDGFKLFSGEGQAMFHLIGLFVLTPIFAGRYFQAMSDRRAALLTLMRPASRLEKWLLAVIIVAVLYPLAFTAAYYLVNLPVWLISRARAAQYLAELALVNDPNSESFASATFQYGPKQFEPFVPFRFPRQIDLLPILLWLATLQAFAMFGSLTLRSVPFIKTVLAAFVLVLAMVFVSSAFDSSPHLWLGYWTSTQPLSGWQKVLYPFAWFAVPAGLWLACLLALKEREIAS